MGRDIKLRSSYSLDAQYVSRIGRAINADPRIGPALKKQIGEAATLITKLLLIDVNAEIEKASQRKAK